MSNTIYFMVLAVIAGAMMPTQAATNNKMAAVIDSPILAAFISFFIGTLGLLVYVVVSGTPLSNMWNAKDAPAVAWVGGVLGAFFVTTTVLLAPRLGVAMTFSLIVLGQMLITLIIDHFGLLGVPIQQVTIARIAGILLVIGGVVLIRKF